jgi:hypothetical protein
VSSKHIDANKMFGLHDDIRHVIVADSMGDVINIFSKTKKRGLLMFKGNSQA